MSKAIEWAQRETETAQEWLTRLKRIDSACLNPRERLLFSVRYRQAVEQAKKETQQQDQQFAEADTVDMKTWRQAKEEALDSPALALAKDVCRCLNADERQRFEAWFRLGCPEDE